MNRNIAIAALLAGAATAVLADDITVDTTTFVSSRTRAEVQADLGQFKQAGVNPWSTTHDPLRGFRSGVSRAQVQAGYIASREQVRAFTREDSGSAYLTLNTRALSATKLAGQPAEAQ